MAKSSFEVASDWYYSNCLVEAFRHHPKKVYFCKPRKMTNGRWQKAHFMWTDGCFDYDFSDSITDYDARHMRWWQMILYRGCIRRFRLGFAKRYSQFRNSKDNPKFQ